MMEIMKMVSEIPMENQYAGFLKRLKAFGFDYLLICACIILLAGITFMVVRTSDLIGFPLRWPENPFRADCPYLPVPYSWLAARRDNGSILGDSWIHPGLRFGWDIHRGCFDLKKTPHAI
jgi:hypothetical protein